jgi:prepilin-type N-terminal cleavage/methylation domain-containing protein
MCDASAPGDLSLTATHRRLGLRKRCEARGFTLIEVMAVMVMLTIVASATFVGMNRHTFDSSHRRFLDDVYGLVVQARNRAIEDQTEVIVEVNSNYIAMRVVDAITHVEEEYLRYDLSRLYGTSLASHVCFLGIFAGVTAPGMPSPIATAPTDCLGAAQEFSFAPDGTFVSGEISGSSEGLTIVSADLRFGDQLRYSLIELFPGGAMRRIDNIVVSE